MAVSSIYEYTQYTWEHTIIPRELFTRAAYCMCILSVNQSEHTQTDLSSFGKEWGRVGDESIVICVHK